MISICIFGTTCVAGNQRPFLLSLTALMMLWHMGCISLTETKKYQYLIKIGTARVGTNGLHFCCWCCDTWCKMAVLSRFFQMFIVLGMYNFDCNKKITFDYSLYFWNSVHGWEWMAFVIVVGSNDAVTHDAAFSKWL